MSMTLKEAVRIYKEAEEWPRCLEFFPANRREREACAVLTEHGFGDMIPTPDPAPAPAQAPAPVEVQDEEEPPTHFHRVEVYTPPTPQQIFAEALKSEGFTEAPYRDARGVKVVRYKRTTNHGGEGFSSLGGAYDSWESSTASVFITEDGSEIVRPIMDAQTSMNLSPLEDYKGYPKPTSDFLPVGCYHAPQEWEYIRNNAEAQRKWAAIAQEENASLALAAKERKEADFKAASNPFAALAALKGGK